MSVTQVHEALGSFEFELLANVPRDVLDNIQYFGHIAIIPGRLDPRQYGDGCLSAARYVGVVRKIRYADDGRTNLIQDDIRVGGVGMEFWLGDDNDKGYVLETAVSFTAQPFSTVMSTLRPASISNGTTYSVTGSYSGRHQYETPRSAIKYVCDTMSTSAIPVGYRVTNDAKLNAGPESSLFVTTPTCIIMRKGGTQGEDMFMRALPSTVDMDTDMEDFATRVVMLAESDGDTFATGTADIGTVSPGTNVYKDLLGNALVLTKLVSESDTVVTNANTRAELALRDVINPHRTLTINADDYDIHGSFEVGDYIYLYDPDAGLIDVANEVTIRGVRVNPIKLRVTEANWPITMGYTVAYRDSAGTWMDLTDYIHFEEEQPATLVVGDFIRDLTTTSNAAATRMGAIIPPDTSTPGVVSWVTASFQTVNYEDSFGNAKARQKLVWSTPLNVDSTAITDGSHYEVQYRLNTGSQYSQTWSALSTLAWNALNTWNQPVAADNVQWQTLNIPWGDTTTVIHELPVGTVFDSRIRAVDNGSNQGAWSSTTTWTTSEDDIPPSQPAPATVAGSLIAVQITHQLGKSSGGTFNLETDLHHLEVHVEYEPYFTPSITTLRGTVIANQGMMLANTAAIVTVPVDETSARYVRVVAVDRAGNRSAPSDAASATAVLIDSQYISELTASKISAGTISADIIVGARFKTADTGARVELNSGGIGAWNAAGQQTVAIAGADGSVSIIGQLKSGTSGKRIEINPTSTFLPEIRWYPNSGTDFGYINAVSAGLDVSLGMNSSPYDDGTGVQVISRTFLNTATAEFAVVRQDDGLRRGGYVWATASNIFVGYNRAGVEGGNMYADANGVQLQGTLAGAQRTILYGGSTYARVGYSGSGTNENYMDYQDTGWTYQIGKLYMESRGFGSIGITPSAANTPTSATITGLTTKGDSFYAFATPRTSVPGTQVTGVGTASPSSTGVTIWLTRTNTTATAVDWMVAGWL